MSKGFELNAAADAAKAEDEGQIIEVLDATGEPLMFTEDGVEKPVTMTVAGTYSKAHRRAEARWNERMMRARRAKFTAEIADDRMLELCSSCVLEWAGFHANGKPVPCTRENVRKVLEAAPWIREQVWEAMNDHAGFSKSSSAT